MARYKPFSGDIDMEGVDPEQPYGASLWIHENVHRSQHKRLGLVSFMTRYYFHPWQFEREAYYAQICYLLQEDMNQDRFAWLRDILEVGYSDATPELVEDLLDEIGL